MISWKSIAILLVVAWGCASSEVKSVLPAATAPPAETAAPESKEQPGVDRLAPLVAAFRQYSPVIADEVEAICSRGSCDVKNAVRCKASFQEVQSCEVEDGEFRLNIRSMHDGSLAFKMDIPDARVALKPVNFDGPAPDLALRIVEGAQADATRRVTHTKSGGGVVVKDLGRDKLEIQFDTGETRVLLSRFVAPE